MTDATPLETASDALGVLRSQYLRGGEDRARAIEAITWYVETLDFLSPEDVFTLAINMLRTHPVYGTA